MKNVLVLCTGNSCRSIIAEAQINAFLEGINAQSSGVKASGRVNPHAQALLEAKGVWRETYHSKVLEEVQESPFDLIVTVCDHANETCPMFPKPVPRLHISFEDPDGKGAEAFETTYTEIKERLLPAVVDFFNNQKS